MIPIIMEISHCINTSDHSCVKSMCRCNKNCQKNQWKHFFRWEILWGNTFFQNYFQVWQRFKGLFWNFYMVIFGIDSAFVSFSYLASFYQFSVVFLCLLLLSLCWLSPLRTCAASHRKFKYFLKSVSCLRCQPSHYHRTSSPHFAWKLEH